MIEVEKVSGIADFEKIVEEKQNGERTEKRELYSVNGTVFLVINKNTFEMRSDVKLAKLLREKYESVMESRYFGRGGIEIVDAGQLNDDEVADLIRLSYNLSKDMA